MSYDPAGVEKASRDLLVAIGEDPEREGLVGTPDRMARAWREMCKGLTEDPREHLRTQFHAGTDELVLVRDITFFSVCEHHLLPFYGRAHVDEVCAGGNHLARVAQRGRNVRVTSPVRERIGGDVEDAHDRRPTDRQAQVTGQRQGRDRGRGRGGGQGQGAHVIGSRTGRGPSSRRGSRRRS